MLQQGSRQHDVCVVDKKIVVSCMLHNMLKDDRWMEALHVLEVPTEDQIDPSMDTVGTDLKVLQEVHEKGLAEHYYVWRINEASKKLQRMTQYSDAIALGAVVTATENNSNMYDRYMSYV